MNPAFLSPIVIHLGQSTLFALLAIGVAFLLRKSEARIRYWILWAASLKFLIPFGPFGSEPGLPPTLLLLWVTSSAAIFTVWACRWRRVARAARRSDSVSVGREYETLRRIEACIGVEKPTELRLSGGSLEPGIFGILRPTLVLPAGIGCHLSKPQLDSVIAHELSHLRRFDNLTASIHLAVATVFWFHPLVWWLGSRLVDERERACDEEVLKISAPREYAEGILRVSELYMQSPIVTVSGVTGSDLKKRIHGIMAQQEKGSAES